MLFLDQKTEMANFFDLTVYDDTIVRYYNLIENKTSCRSSYHRGAWYAGLREAILRQIKDFL